MSLSNEELIKQEMIAVAIMAYRKHMESQNTVTLGSRLHDFQDFVKDTKVASDVFGRISSIFSKGMPNTHDTSPAISPVSPTTNPILLDSSTTPIVSGTPVAPASSTTPIVSGTPVTPASSTTPIVSGTPVAPASSTTPIVSGTPVAPASSTTPIVSGTPVDISDTKSPFSDPPKSTTSLKKTIDNNLPKLCGGDKNPKLITPYNLTLIIKPEHFGEIIIISFNQEENNILIQRKQKGIFSIHPNGVQYRNFLLTHKQYIPNIDEYKILSVVDTTKLIKEFTNSNLKIIGGYYKNDDIISFDKMKNISFDEFIQEINSGSD